MKAFNAPTPAWVQKFDPDNPLTSQMYHRVGPDKRFGNTIVYETNTKTLGLFIKDGEQIGTTGVWGDTTSNGVFAIVWVRRHRLNQIKEAVACALMLHEHIAIIRAFKP